MRVLQPRDYVNDYALKLVDPNVQILFWYVEAGPKLVDLLCQHSRATVVDRLELAHWLLALLNLPKAFDSVDVRLTERSGHVRRNPLELVSVVYVKLELGRDVQLP